MILPPLAEILDNSQVVALPLVGSFRGLNRRTALLFEGPNGWAEFAPFSSHDIAHSARWLEAAISQAYGSWPESEKTSVPINGILPEISVEAAADFAEMLFLDYGIEVIKLKTSESFENDLLKIREISERITAVGGVPCIRLDVNATWELPAAVANLNRLQAEFENIEYVEQPVENLDDLRELKNQTTMPIALDETLRLAEPGSHDFESINQIADFVILKAIPLGGVNESLVIADSITKPIVVSGSLDTSVGLAAGIQLAALLPETTAGLGTDILFGSHISSSPHTITAGRIEVGRKTPDLIAQSVADNAETSHMRERLVSSYEYLSMMNNLEQL